MKAFFAGNPRVVVLILCWLISVSAFTQTDHPPYVLMVSLDGFRWDYPDKVNLPCLRDIAQRGVKAKALIPSFPTKTFPNHYSMATGLYPANHGIVMNSFYDPEMSATYRISDRKAVMDASFYGGEPIWVTAEMQGMTTASFFWVGSEAAVKGIQPTYWKPYQHNFPYEARIDSVIAWLSLPQELRPRLVMLYFDEPDGVGHAYGPEAPVTIQTLLRLDSLMGVLVKKLEALPIFDSLNVIITSDHGMGSISAERSVVLSEIIPHDWIIRAEGGNPGYNLEVKDGYLDSVLLVLDQVPGIKAWRTGEAPERLFYRNNPRLLDLCVVADSSWSVHWKENFSYGRGTHGYDNANSDMHAIFYAMGPSFRKGIVVPPFANVSLYPMLAHILRLKPALVDGNLDEVLPALAPH